MLVADPHSPDFNSYASLADLRTFAAGRGYAVPADDNQLVLLSGEGDAQYSPFAVINGQMFVSEAFIQYGEITLAKIGELRSSNYIEGKTGTIMKADGTFELNGGTEGEGAMKITNETITVRDKDGVVRVQIGRITGVW